MLSASGLSRSTFYYHDSTKSKIDKNSELKALIIKIYEDNFSRYGYRRITAELQNKNVIVNHKKVLRLMKEMGLKSLIRGKKYRSYKGRLGAVPNLLNRDFKATKPGQKWVTDATEFKVGSKKLYLSPILDLYNREIVAYNFSERPCYELVGDMLDKAINKLKKDDFPILHSDQGWHYHMCYYQQKLKERNIVQSMSRKGNCLDNAVIENFFGLLKSEVYYLNKYDTIEQLKADIEEYIHYYNHRRIKLSLDKKSPVQYREYYFPAA
ncbi:Transposase InsO and inactivated derivatives [Gilliamella bombicola]|uniref:Transposase InsO and inactivated derivatives n=1 Tax=Gilliamella bombicola TaxID=1798182 RepID=A0A1C4ATP0_9GAMM|nr:Transposase InsO and inactivated derivatives [Gilliamella bombicola]